MRRDPETGQFVSSGGGTDWTDTTRVVGTLHSSIPAADLAGGTNEYEAIGDEVEVIDFGSTLDNDEVFRVLATRTTAVLAMPTTATAESSAQMSYGVSMDAAAPVLQVDDPFYTGKVHKETGIIDTTNSSDEANELLTVGELAADASAADTTNGLGVGADIDRDRQQTAYGGAGPVFDKDDELYIPHEFGVDNISDHAVNASFSVFLHGVVEQLD